MALPGVVSRHVLAGIWLLVGLALVGLPLWFARTRWEALLTGHPSTLLLELGCLMAGVVAIAWAIGMFILGRRPGLNGRRAGMTIEQLRRAASGRIAGAVVALVVCVAAGSLLFLAQPYPAGSLAISWLTTSETVRMNDRVTWYELEPITQDKDSNQLDPTVGLVFVPAARVDPRAYAATLRPLAEAGYLVVILKEPFGLSLANVDHADAPIKVHPEIEYWATGGHGLGGITAAAYADQHPKTISGLVLIASYPEAKITRADLEILSVTGTADRRTSPADRAKSRSALPPDTQYVQIEGATRASFADYQAPASDGTPTVDPHEIRREAAEATRTLLASLPPKKK